MRNGGRWRSIVAVLTLAALAACGSGSGRGADAGIDGDDVVRLQPGDRPVRFRLDTAVSEDMRRFVVETLEWAHHDLGDSGPLTVHVYSDAEHFVVAYTSEFAITADEARDELSGGQTAFASPGGHIWIYLTNFEDVPEDVRREALFHEYVHTLQEWQAEVRFQSSAPEERSFVPRWLVEGCAEYLAVRAGTARGFSDLAAERSWVVDEAKGSDEPLEAFETRGEAEFLGGHGEAYTLGWLGCERLAVTTRGGHDGVTYGFWLAMARDRDWHKAFAEAFGTTVGDFYSDFARFRSTL
jgi:hypothetical protein